MPLPTIQILVCVNQRAPDAVKPSCGQREAIAVYRRFKDVVRARGIRDHVMVVRTGCLKHCDQGITVCIWPANRWYRRVSLDRVEEIVELSVMRNEVVADLVMPDVPWQ